MDFSPSHFGGQAIKHLPHICKATIPIAYCVLLHTWVKNIGTLMEGFCKCFNAIKHAIMHPLCKNIMTHNSNFVPIRVALTCNQASHNSASQDTWAVGCARAGITKAPFLNFSESNIFDRTKYLLHFSITFIFDRCRRSWAAAKPGKYERDIK